jgi:hypothetical protein
MVAPQNNGFSARTLGETAKNIKALFNSQDGWITFDLFIKILNREKVFKFENNSEEAFLLT